VKQTLCCDCHAKKQKKDIGDLEKGSCCCPIVGCQNKMFRKRGDYQRAKIFGQEIVICSEHKGDEFADEIDNSKLMVEFRKRLADSRLKLVDRDWKTFDGVVFVKDLTIIDKKSNTIKEKITALYNNEKALKTLNYPEKGKPNLFEMKEKCPNCEKSDYLENCDECEREFCMDCLGLYHDSERLFCDTCFDKKPTKEKHKMICDTDGVNGEYSRCPYNSLKKTRIRK